MHLSRLITKPTKWHVRPARTQTSLGIRPVWSESSLSAWRKLGSLATHWAHSEDWSDWADAQADLSLCWAHMPFCWFCLEAAHFIWTPLDIICSRDLRGLVTTDIQMVTNIHRYWTVEEKVALLRLTGNKTKFSWLVPNTCIVLVQLIIFDCSRWLLWVETDARYFQISHLLAFKTELDFCSKSDTLWIILLEVAENATLHFRKERRMLTVLLKFLFLFSILWDIETRGIILSRQRTTKALTRLRGCAGWSVPLLFAYGINRFSHDVAQIAVFLSIFKTISAAVCLVTGDFVDETAFLWNKCIMNCSEWCRPCLFSLLHVVSLFFSL